MRRCVLVSSRIGEDKETKKPLLFLTMYRLPNKMKNGRLYSPKQSDAVITTCISKENRPEEFELLKEVLPCTLVDVTFGINDFNNKSYVAKLDLVKETVNIFDENLLYK